jgi:Protein of unknown function (DUF2958)
MKLLLEEHRQQLHANWTHNAASRGETTDFKPVVKLFVPWGAGTWLLTELDPDDNDTAFGLCDLGMQSPELGNVSLAEMMSVRGPGGLTIERDRHFTAKMTLAEYAEAAREAGYIKA